MRAVAEAEQRAKDEKLLQNDDEQDYWCLNCRKDASLNNKKKTKPAKKKPIVSTGSQITRSRAVSNNMISPS